MLLPSFFLKLDDSCDTVLPPCPCILFDSHIGSIVCILHTLAKGGNVFCQLQHISILSLPHTKE